MISRWRILLTMRLLKAFGITIGILTTCGTVLAHDGPGVKQTDPILFDGETHPVGSPPGAGSGTTNGQSFGQLIHARVSGEGDPIKIPLSPSEFYEIANYLAVLLADDANNPHAKSRRAFAAMALKAKLTKHLAPIREDARALDLLLDSLENKGRSVYRSDKLTLKKLAEDLQYRIEKFVSSTSIRAVHLGYSTSTSSPSLYGSVFFATPESRSKCTPWETTSFGITGLAIPSVGSEPHPVIYRIGAAAAIGDPDQAVLSLNYGQYLHPDVHDAEVRVSEKVGGNHFEERINGRHVFDFVRGGDFWITESGRILSSQQNGSAAEFSVTYGLPVKSKNEKYKDAVPSITTSVTYCQQKRLGLDEGSVEFRVPVLHANDIPVYITARYGTRSDGSLGIAFRF